MISRNEFLRIEGEIEKLLDLCREQGEIMDECLQYGFIKFMIDHVFIHRFDKASRLCKLYLDQAEILYKLLMKV